MSQPKIALNSGRSVDGVYWISLDERDLDYEAGIDFVFAKTKKTAYKRAAAKLNKLADEAERLAEES